MTIDLSLLPKPCPIGLQALRVMLLIFESDSQSLTSTLAANELGVSQAAMTGTFDRLETLGLAKRTRTQNRRKRPLVLTRAGEEWVRRLARLEEVEAV